MDLVVISFLCWFKPCVQCCGVRVCVYVCVGTPPVCVIVIVVSLEVKGFHNGPKSSTTGLTSP